MDTEAINSLVESGDWLIDEKEFNDFINHKLDSFMDNKVELEFHGNVTFGNDRFGFTLQHKQGDEIYLLYSQTTPADKYQSKTEKEERFNFNFGSENFEDPATYEKTKYESSIFKTIPVDEIGKSLTELKAFVSNYFAEQQLISPQYAPQYKAIRENGTNFFIQRQEALGNYFQNLLKQPKLSPKELSDLAVYYDNKVYKNLAATGQEDMENAVKWMLQDGLKPSQIAIIGTEMISCDPLDQNLVKKVLKSPVIKQFQEELKRKAMAATKAK